MEINEIINKYYSDIRSGKNAVVDEKTLLLFCKEYLKINELKEKYHQSDVNRKEIGKEIIARKKQLEDLSVIFNNDLNRGCVRYVFSEYISDYSKAINMLLMMANQNEGKYILKKFTANQIGSLETRHGDKESGMFEGEIWVIGEKVVLDEIDNTKPYYGAKFGLLATKLVENNHSLAVITNYYYETNVMPYSINTKAKETVFNVNGSVSNLCCYTFDDELGMAVNKLSDYIETYGGDMDNIEVDDLVKRINGIQLVKTKEGK